MQKISKIFKELFEISELEVLNASYLNTEKWDSLGHIALIIELEKAFVIEINGSQVNELTSYQKIVDFISNVQNKDNITFNKITKTPLEKPKVHRGLNNIYFDETRIGFVDQENSVLYYRSRSIDKLVNNNFTLEEIIHLVLYEHLPTQMELNQLKQSLQRGRLLVCKHKDFLLAHDFLCSKKFLQSTIPIISHLISDDLEYISALPALIFLHNNAKLQHCLPDEKILDIESHAEFVLSCLQPSRSYSAQEYKIFEKQMIVHMEHGSNASTFACRTTCSTGGSFTDALLSAISTFSGRLHGGAMENVSIMIDQLSKNPDILEAELEKRVLQAEPIYGFGHRVYKNNDPRALVLNKLMEELVLYKGQSDFVVIANRIVGTLEKYSQKGLGINVDFYSSLILKIMDFDLDMYLPSFISSRIVGWLAHYNEQKDNNILIRPRLYYNGDILDE